MIYSFLVNCRLGSVPGCPNLIYPRWIRTRIRWRSWCSVMRSWRSQRKLDPGKLSVRDLLWAKWRLSKMWDSGFCLIFVRWPQKLCGQCVQCYLALVPLITSSYLQFVWRNVRTFVRLSSDKSKVQLVSLPRVSSMRHSVSYSELCDNGAKMLHNTIT